MDIDDKEKVHAVMTSLYRDNYKKILSMVLKDELCRPMAEDIVQDTFFEAVRRWETVSVHENPGGWLMKTAQNKMLALRRKVNSRSVHETEEAELDMLGFEDEYGLIEVDMILDSSLSIHEKTLFQMFYLEGYSLKELAEMEKITEVNMKVRMHRIRDKIRQELQGKKKRRKK